MNRANKASAIRILAAVVSAAALAASGCAKRQKPAPAARPDPAVKLVKPERRTISRTIGQPAFIDAFERTSMYPKIAGYILKWNVDIGDRIRKDQPLCQLFVPELEAEFEQKQAEVVRDKALIDVAQQNVSVAQAHVDAAEADAVKAQADVGAFQSAVDRWESEVKRLTKMADERVVDRQVLDESQKQLKSNVASRDAAQAGVKSAQAEVVARRAELDKARADVDAARASAKVAEANENRYRALYGYTTLSAPYDGIVIIRNANTGDFVQPAGGDRSVETARPGSPPATGLPIYVVARTDLVRVYVDVPEMDASHIGPGTVGHVRVPALNDSEFDGAVTRSSWALNQQTRTLRAEIDLPNSNAAMLPGMYAYGEITIVRMDVLALPLAAIADQGEQKVCFLHQDGAAVKTPVQVGGDDGTWIEVARKRVNGKWVPFDGDEQVITGEMSELRDGEKVDVLPIGLERTMSREQFLDLVAYLTQRK